MTRLFKPAAGMGQPSSRYARLELAHTGDLQKRRYTNGFNFDWRILVPVERPVTQQFVWVSEGPRFRRNQGIDIHIFRLQRGPDT